MTTINIEEQADTRLPAMLSGDTKQAFMAKNFNIISP